MQKVTTTKSLTIVHTISNMYFQINAVKYWGLKQDKTFLK